MNNDQLIGRPVTEMDRDREIERVRIFKSFERSSRKGCMPSQNRRPCHLRVRWTALRATTTDTHTRTPLTYFRVSPVRVHTCVRVCCVEPHTRTHIATGTHTRTRTQTLYYARFTGVRSVASECPVPRPCTAIRNFCEVLARN